MDLSSRVSTLLGPQQPVLSSGEVGARNAGRTAWPTSLQTLSTEAALAASRVKGASVRMCRHVASRMRRAIGESGSDEDTKTNGFIF